MTTLLVSLHSAAEGSSSQTLARQQLLTTALGILLNIAEEATPKDRQELAGRPVLGGCNFLHWLCRCCCTVRVWGPCYAETDYTVAAVLPAKVMQASAAV